MNNAFDVSIPERPKKFKEAEIYVFVRDMTIAVNNHEHLGKIQQGAQSRVAKHNEQLYWEWTALLRAQWPY